MEKKLRKTFLNFSELETTSREETRRLKNEIEDVSQEKLTIERKMKNLEADLDVSRQEGTNLRMTINTMTAAQASIKAEIEAVKVRKFMLNKNQKVIGMEKSSPMNLLIILVDNERVQILFVSSCSPLGDSYHEMELVSGLEIGNSL